MPSTRVSVVAAADLEMLYESWLLQYSDLVVDFTACTVNTLVQNIQKAIYRSAPRLRRWLQLKLERSEPQKLLPLPHPVAFPLSLQHMDFIAHNFADVKTELQLIHGVVDGLKTELQLVRDNVNKLQTTVEEQTTKLNGQLKRLREEHTPLVDGSAVASTGERTSLEKITKTDSNMRNRPLELVGLEAPLVLDRNSVDDFMDDLKNFFANTFLDIMNEHQEIQNTLLDKLRQESLLSVPENQAAHSQAHQVQANELVQVYQLAARASTTDGSDPVKLERQREQNRSRQLRYLQKKRQYESDLSASVVNLQSEMQRLQQQLFGLHQRTCSTSANSSPPSSTQTPDINLQTAQELVYCFRSGFPCTDPAPWLPSASNQEQIRFVRQKIHPDLFHNDLSGQNSFLEQWRLYTTCFGSLSLRPSSFQLVSECVCHVDLHLSLGLIFASFQRVFPHLLQPQYSVLLQQLVNQQIHVPMTLQLQFDDRNRVVRCDSTLDFISALRPLLSSYEAVSTVVQRARVSSVGHIDPDTTNSSPRDARLALSFVLSPMD